MILTNIAMAGGLDLAKVPMQTLSKYGNQSSASIPCALCDCLKENLAMGTHKLLLSGFGIGLCWASCVVNVTNLYCSSVYIYKE